MLVFANFPKRLKFHETGLGLLSSNTALPCIILNMATPQIGDKGAGRDTNKTLFFCLLKMNHTHEEVNRVL